MKEINIYDEENSIVIDDEFHTVDFTFYPEEKKYHVSSSVKDDCFFNEDIMEYKISTNPIELYIRTLESSHEPPLEYSIKDGVVLESEIKKSENELFATEERINELKKQVEWQKFPIFGHYQVNLYILSKHPEIISKDEFNRFLRQSLERIKKGVLKVEEAVKQDTLGLEISTGKYGKSIWYPNTEVEKKEMDDFYDLPAEKRKGTKYEKKIEYVEKFYESLFNEDSKSFVGISKHEFSQSQEIIEYIDKLLATKVVQPKKTEPDGKISKGQALVVSILLTLFISWVVSWFVDINPFLIFVLVQVVSFIQSIIGTWVSKLLES